MDDRDALRARVHGANGGDDATEDWLRSDSWDFWRDDGTPVDDLTELCNQLGRGDTAAVAADLLHLPWGEAAPEPLLAQARALVQ